MPDHRPVHRSPLQLFLAALVHLCRTLAALAVLAFAAYAAWERDAHWLGLAAVASVVWAVFALIHAFEGARCNCAVCSGRLFTASRNVKHHSARRLFGSHRLRTACQVLLTVAYHCPHCGAVVACRDEKTQPLPEPQPRLTRGRRARIPAASQPAIILHSRTNGLLKKNKNR